MAAAGDDAAERAKKILAGFKLWVVLLSISFTNAI